MSNNKIALPLVLLVSLIGLSLLYYIQNKSVKNENLTPISSWTSSTIISNTQTGIKVFWDQTKLLEVYDKNPNKFDITQAVPNLLYHDIFNECSENDIVALNKSGVSFLTTVLETQDPRANCGENPEAPYCKFLLNYKKQKTFSFEEMKYVLFGIFYKDVSVEDAKKILNGENKIQFPNPTADEAYTRYYIELLDGKISNERECMAYIEKLSVK